MKEARGVDSLTLLNLLDHRFLGMFGVKAEKNDVQDGRQDTFMIVFLWFLVIKRPCGLRSKVSFRTSVTYEP